MSDNTLTPAQAQIAAEPEVHWKCKRDGCDSIIATEVPIPGHNTASGRHMYRCKKCGFTWNTNLGGSVNF
jgi:hypothetical protein